MPSASLYVVPKLSEALYDCKMTSPDKCGITHAINLGVFGNNSLRSRTMKVPIPEPVPPARL